MTVWLIEPRDPLMFRDGKPFNASPGARASTLSFPYPATIAGATRTLAGTGSNGRFNKSRIGELLDKHVHGPVLTLLNEDGTDMEWLFPAPADALVLKHDPYDSARAHIVPVTVLAMPPGATSNLPEPLALVGPAKKVTSKPHPEAPAFWCWESYRAWLLKATGQDAELGRLGFSGPARESRMHVSIAGQTQTAEDGALFQTAGLEFVNIPAPKEGAPPSLSQARHLALVLRTDADLSEGLGFLGGERRVARWRRCPDQLPECPVELREAIVNSKHCRLILATPAIFGQGYLPEENRLSRSGVTVHIRAVVNHRYQVVSGWDYDKALPKPTKRLAPAGSVYFLELGGDEPAIRQFVDNIWLQTISDEAQDCRDGFGLALIGAWDGKSVSLSYRTERNK